MFDFGSYGYIAEKDLIRSEKNLYVEEFEVSCTYSQQAIEKILKEYIQSTVFIENIDILLKSHNVRLLAMKTNIQGLIKYKDVLSTIKDYYYETRYPGINYIECKKSDAIEAFNVAKDIFNIVKGALSDTKCTNEFE